MGLFGESLPLCRNAETLMANPNYRCMARCFLSPPKRMSPWLYFIWLLFLWCSLVLNSLLFPAGFWSLAVGLLPLLLLGRGSQGRFPGVVQGVGPADHLHVLVGIVINHISLNKKYFLFFPKAKRLTENSNFGVGGGGLEGWGGRNLVF